MQQVISFLAFYTLLPSIFLCMHAHSASLCFPVCAQVKCVPCNGKVYGEDNLMFMANDWHTALLPVYLQVRSLVLATLCL